MQHQAKSDLADPIHDSFTPPLTSLSRDDSIMPHETSGWGMERAMPLNLQSGKNAKSKAYIVALHCSLGSGKQWSKLIDACGNQYHAIALDISGYSKNEPWHDPAPSSLDSEAAYLHQELKALPGPIHLVGHSFGGAIAFKLATSKRYVRCVRSLTLIEPVLPSILLEHEPDRPFYESFARESEHICTPIWLGDKERGLQQFLTFWNGHVCWENLSRNRKAAFIERVNKLVGDFSAVFGETGVTEAASRLSVPTLLFSGARSPRATQRIAKRLTSIIPGSRHIHLATAGHMLAITHSNDLDPQILQHIAAAESRMRLAVPLAAGTTSRDAPPLASGR
jgi:pimeloyl-ACP methyl ester carboxylesterase